MGRERAVVHPGKCRSPNLVISQETASNMVEGGACKWLGCVVHSSADSPAVVAARGTELASIVLGRHLRPYTLEEHVQTLSDMSLGFPEEWVVRPSEPCELRQTFQKISQDIALFCYSHFKTHITRKL